MNLCESPFAVSDNFLFSAGGSLCGAVTLSFSCSTFLCGLPVAVPSSSSIGLALLKGEKAFPLLGLLFVCLPKLLPLLGMVRWLRRLTLLLTFAPMSARLVCRLKMLLSRRWWLRLLWLLQVTLGCSPNNLPLSISAAALEEEVLLCSRFRSAVLALTPTLLPLPALAFLLKRPKTVVGPAKEGI